MVARPDGEGRTLWTALNACLLPILALDGQEMVTAEGLGLPGDLHPVQEEMACRGGSQCGYCTPGFICSMAAEYYRPDRGAAPSAKAATAKQRHADHEHGPNGFDLHALSGNLCRCTGYRPIRDAAYALGAPPADDPLAARSGDARARRAVHPGARRRGRVRPARRPRRRARACWPSARTPPSSRAAPTGASRSTSAAPAPRSWSPSTGCPSCGRSRWAATDIELGAALTLSEAERLLEGRVPLLDALWPQFASRLIRNGATLGGNLGTGSPIGDAPPALLALRASVVLAGPDGEREVPLDEYFTGYRRTVKRARRADQGRAHAAAARPAHRLPQDRQAAVRRHLQRRRGVRPRRRLDGVVVRRRHRARRRRGHADPRHRDRGRARRQAVGRRHRPGGRRRAAAARARRSTTTGPAPPTGRRCSNSRCSSSTPNRARPRGARMTELSTRPPQPVVGMSMPHESADLHVTGLALYTDDLVNRHLGTLHAYPVQAPHTHAHVTVAAHGARARACPVSCACSPPPTCPA